MARQAAAKEHKAQVTANITEDKSVKGLAGNIFKHLRAEGFDSKDIISVSSQLLSLVTSELQSKSDIS